MSEAYGPGRIRSMAIGVNPDAFFTDFSHKSAAIPEFCIKLITTHTSANRSHAINSWDNRQNVSLKPLRGIAILHPRLCGVKAVFWLCCSPVAIFMTI